ncbi:hypothetical protein BN128_3610 [Cronobacter sakazakii 696]|nr:hypothetical protein BN128_3610 [Cronobacter sakazakii 696]
MQRHIDFKLTVVLFIREVLRITDIDQRGVLHLSALNRTAQVIDEIFTHQVFREVAPGLSGIGGLNTCQYFQPGLAVFRLLITEITARPQGMRLHIKMFTGKREALRIVAPVQRRLTARNLKRRAEHRLVRHPGVRHIDRRLAMRWRAGNRAGKMLRARQKFPLLPGEIAPAGQKTRFVGRLKWDIERQRINFPFRARAAPHFAKRGRKPCCKR